jgi:hypothetical protein
LASGDGDVIDLTAIDCIDDWASLEARISVGPRNLVIDPLSALTGTTSASEARNSVERLIAEAKSTGITLLATSLLEGREEHQEETAAGVSTIADTWIHLSYVIQQGERNRALTIVKSRGMGHSNQVRELILTDKGVTLADTYSRRRGLMRRCAGRRKSRAKADRLVENARPTPGASRSKARSPKAGADRGPLDRARGSVVELKLGDELTDDDVRNGTPACSGGFGARTNRPPERPPPRSRKERVGHGRTRSGTPEPPDEVLKLRLYVAGRAPNSLSAIANLRSVLPKAGVPVVVEIVDVLNEPARALTDRIVVSPTLLRVAPMPVVRVVGNLSDLGAVRRALGFGSPS